MVSSFLAVGHVQSSGEEQSSPSGATFLRGGVYRRDGNIGMFSWDSTISSDLWCRTHLSMGNSGECFQVILVVKDTQDHSSLLPI